MNSVKYLIFSVTLAAFLLAGCARVGTTTSLDCPDADNDGICNQYEKNGTLDGSLSGDTTPVECKLADGSSVYLDCSLTTDCNCNEIPDNEEKEMTKDCGWGCVSSNARTWVMVGTALLGGYIAGQLIDWPYWPFGDKDTTGNVIEYVEAMTVSFTDSDSDGNVDSYLRFEDSDEKTYMIIHVEGTCKSQLSAEFKCGYESKNQITKFPVGYNLIPISDPFSGNLEYSYNLAESPVKGMTKEYIKIYDSRTSQWEYVKDPKWFGFEILGEGVNRAITTLSSKSGTCPSCMFAKLVFGESTPTNFTVGQYQTMHDSDYLNYTWLRSPD